MVLRFFIFLLRFTSRFTRKKSLTPIHSLVVVELTRLGDVLSMLPAVRVLAQHYCQACISLVVDERYASLLRAFMLRADVYGIEKPETLLGFFRTVLHLRRLKADLALSMSPPKRNVAVTLMSGAKRKVGYLTYRDSVAPYLRTTPVEAIGCELHTRETYEHENIEERSLKVCRALGIQSEHSLHRIELEAGACSHAQQQLATNGSLPKMPYVVLHPFSGWHFRSWPLERFIELADEIHRRAQHDVVFVCEYHETPRLRAVVEYFRDCESVHVFASNDLLMTAILLKDAALVVGNDSGPLHLAAGLGSRVIGLFGPASPALTAPRDARGEFHYQQVECSPCDQRVCVRPHQWCMAQISVEAVTRSVLAQLSVQPVVQAVANA